MIRTGTRDLSLAWVAVVALAFSSGCGEEQIRPENRFNLLVIAVDTLRADHLGSYGYELDTSPNLDAFAAKSLRFDNAQSAAPWTAPSLISLMTSLHPEVHQVLRFPNPGRLAEKTITLAEVLRDAGYATGAFTEGGYAKGEFGLDQGFDVYPANPGDEDSHGSNLMYPSRIRGNVDRTIEWIRSKQDQRFFAFFQTYETHTPFRAPEPFIRKFRPDFSLADERSELAEIVARWDAGTPLSDRDWTRLIVHRFHCLLVEAPAPARPGLWDAVFARIEPFDGGTGSYPADAIEILRDLYDAEIAYTDRQISRLWRELARLGLADETIVVIVADHGEGLGDHGLIEHGKVLTEEILRVALVIRFPGETGRAGTVDTLVRSIDVMPTLLDFMQIPRDGLTLQGVSLAKIIDGQAGEEFAFSQGTSQAGKEDPWLSVRTDRWRLVTDSDRDQSWLFDLEHDPSELANLADRFPEVATRLRKKIREQHEVDVALREVVSGDVEATDMDPELREELKALGYIE
jgi:arylsulfatase